MSCEIILADQIAIGVHSGLAGNEDDAAGHDLDDLRITRRRAEFGRIDAVDRRRHGSRPQFRGTDGAVAAGGSTAGAFFGFSVPA